MGTAGSAERATRFELVTSSLGSWHSTTELRPQVLMIKGFTSSLLFTIGVVATNTGRRHNILT
jgi:hypothetical protein